MKQALRDDWCAALRSGEYEQGYGTMHRGTKHCGMSEGPYYVTYGRWLHGPFEDEQVAQAYAETYADYSSRNVVARVCAPNEARLTRATEAVYPTKRWKVAVREDSHLAVLERDAYLYVIGTGASNHAAYASIRDKLPPGWVWNSDYTEEIPC